ncbi:MAG: hypothetical protein ACE5RI_09240, partial [Candidatus Nitrosomaritimum yanchengensis]
MNNNKTNSVLKKFIYLFTIPVFLSIILSNPGLSFAEETGSINLEIRFENGDRISNSQTVLKIFQDNDDTPYRTIEFPESNPYTIDSLPLGHKYTVKAYVNDMFAEERFLELNKSTMQMQMFIPLQAGMQFKILYNDGYTPISNAKVSIKSSEGNEWATGNTDSNGKTI